MSKSKDTQVLQNAEFEGADLLLRVRDLKCQASFKKLFQVFYGKIFAYFKKSGVEAEKSAELTQEVFWTVWNKAALFDPDKGSFQVWIFTIARNLRFDFHRKTRNDAEFIKSEDIYSLSEDQLPYQEMPEPRQDLQKFLYQLPQEQTEVLEALYFAGQTQMEYSQATGIPLGTVKSRVRLALLQIKKLMEQV